MQKRRSAFCGTQKPLERQISEELQSLVGAALESNESSVSGLH